MKRRTHIIAIGGGSFGGQPENLALDAYILAQTGKPNPAICFIPTATGDAAVYVQRFYHSYAQLDCRPSHLSFFTRTPNLRETLLQQDAIYVGGGNTKSMLAVWRAWGLPRILRDAWKAGIVLSGVSAGAICWFDAGVTDSWAGRLAALPCLGFLAGGCCPHYDGEKERRPALRALLTSRAMPPTLAIDDGAAAHFIGSKLSRIVSSRPSGGAYFVRRRAGRIAERALRVTRLNAPPASASP